jgi:hypothetical protein
MSDFQEPRATERRVGRQPPSFFWPLLLIGAGVMLLLSNLGYLPWESWNIVWRLWPLLLIALGIDVLIGRRSILGAIVSGLLILILIGGAVVLVLFAQNIPELAKLTQPPEVHVRHIEYPLGNVEHAAVDIDWTSMPGHLGVLRDSSNLIEGDIAYRGELIFDVHTHNDQADVLLDSHFSGPWVWSFGGREDYRWDVQLSPRASLDLSLDTGSGSCDLDLSDLQVSDLFLDVGSGSVDLALPDDSSFEARIEGGSGSIVITLPQGVGARVVVESDSGSFHADGRFRLVEGERHDDGVWETDDFDTAEHTVVLILDQGSGSVDVR